MSAPPRRWFAFRLRTLFVVVAIVALPLAWAVSEARLVQERRMAIARIHAVDPYTCVPYFREQRIGWLRRVLGDYEVETIMLPASMASQQDQIKRLFPEAKIYWERYEGNKYKGIMPAQPPGARPPFKGDDPSSPTTRPS